ncbi:MAG: zinc ribbon domain-containing protein [Candidatus Hodarchaeales archaeon]
MNDQSTLHFLSLYLLCPKTLFKSQIIRKTAHLLREHGVGIWRINPKNSSQTCAICSHYEQGQRHGKTFTCKNTAHQTLKGNRYTCNADLNASRNVTLFALISLDPFFP